MIEFFGEFANEDGKLGVNEFWVGLEDRFGKSLDISDASACWDQLNLNNRDDLTLREFELFTGYDCSGLLPE